jgi:hypothetical protein
MVSDVSRGTVDVSGPTSLFSHPGGALHATPTVASATYAAQYLKSS